MPDNTPASLGETIDGVNNKVIINPIFEKNMDVIVKKIKHIEQSHQDQLSSVLFVPNFHNRFYKSFQNISLVKQPPKNFWFGDAPYNVNFNTVINYYINNIRCNNHSKLSITSTMDETCSMIYTNLDMDDLIKIDILLCNRICRYIKLLANPHLSGMKVPKTIREDMRTVCERIDNIRLLTSENIDNILNDVSFLQSTNVETYDLNAKGSDYYLEKSNSFVRDLLIAEKNYLKQKLSNYSFDNIFFMGKQLMDIEGLFFTISSSKIYDLQDCVKQVRQKIGTMSNDYEFTYTTTKKRFSPELVSNLTLTNNGRIVSNTLFDRPSFSKKYNELYCLSQFLHYNDIRQDTISYKGQQYPSDEFYQQLMDDETITVENDIMFKIRITPTSMKKHLTEVNNTLAGKELARACRERVDEIQRKYDKTGNIVSYYKLDWSGNQKVFFETGIELILKSTDKISYLKLLGVKVNKNWAGQFIVMSNDKVDELKSNLPKGVI